MFIPSKMFIKFKPNIFASDTLLSTLSSNSITGSWKILFNLWSEPINMNSVYLIYLQFVGTKPNIYFLDIFTKFDF